MMLTSGMALRGPAALSPCTRFAGNSNPAAHTPLRFPDACRLGTIARSYHRSNHDDDCDIQETKLGPGVAASVADVNGHLKYSVATVMRNDAVNLEGTIRLLHLTVCDPVDKLYGRKVKSVMDHPRWIDSYTLPGQCVSLRAVGEAGAAAPTGPPKRLFSIASSPYESKRDSAYVDGGIIEVVAERGCSEEDDRLAGLGPGSQLEVSQVIGRGFSSLLNSYVGLMSTLEESRNLLIIAVGTSGMVPARAALRWTPVQAHGTAKKVTCFYVARSPSSAAFLTEWDTWREAGVDFTPLYTSAVDIAEGSAPPSSIDDALDFGDFAEAGPAAGGAGGAAGASSTYGLPPAAQTPQHAVMTLLEVALFANTDMLEAAIGGPAAEVSVMLAGCSGEVASKLTRKLVDRGVAIERVLFCDYF